jgi:hypothetical protein
LRMLKFLLIAFGICLETLVGDFQVFQAHDRKTEAADLDVGSYSYGRTRFIGDLCDALLHVTFTFAMTVLYKERYIITTAENRRQMDCGAMLLDYDTCC